MANRHEVAVVLGTRPEIIKLAGVVRTLGETARVIFTAQHYQDDLSDVFFRSLGLPQPYLSLAGIGGASRGMQIAQGVDQLVQHFETQRPHLVIVQGDTNATSAGAQAANYCGIPLLHVEAGLRSYDRDMPEEINRKVVSVMADVHCAPTVCNANNLLAEGILPAQIRVTGNTIVEATWDAIPNAEVSSAVMSTYGVDGDDFILATIHRPENTDSALRLAKILRELVALPYPVIFPVHPRTAARVREFGLDHLIDRLRPVLPLDRTTFLTLARSARLLISDSGGVLEECTILKKPLVVVRKSTERPEAISTGFAVRVTADEGILDQVSRILADPGLCEVLKRVPSPYGDGKATERIAGIATAMVRGEMPPFTDLDSLGLEYEQPYVYQ
ncbi:non-hydrolyzing UDP-N-acetylglucosamine 2-epimerase [Kitasatospora kifunensis]|uniref:UDP-N-acetylglucosamine 2-epimerase (Non-hydrolyzing) n=1 Tax=Kitasatospora kifunensis TaxID=58351 RepID=A0A7W7RA38_KITKI|nr:UDP-N-acetylglucosamine 2-epimerase (non-hydrolyzing) [Kitasatospora kifunensis]MBB4928164.1 UDP-N-acetylglucosamine 2-epimerase (non-hydrolyzing) [Kitasatospora kifunensis]